MMIACALCRGEMLDQLAGAEDDSGIIPTPDNQSRLVYEIDKSLARADMHMQKLRQALDDVKSQKAAEAAAIDADNSWSSWIQSPHKKALDTARQAISPKAKGKHGMAANQAANYKKQRR